MVLDDVGADHVQLVQLGDGLAVIGDERVVILDQGLKVLLGAGATVDVERLPGAVAGDGIGAAVRRSAQRGDAFGGLIGLREHCLDLRVEHLVHGDEVRPGHVPVSVLQDQRGLLLLAQSVLQNGNGLLGGGFVQSRHNECKCHIRSFLLGYQSPSSLSMKPARCVSCQHSYRSQ